MTKTHKYCKMSRSCSSRSSKRANLL